MAQEIREPSEAMETDIVFDCPSCGKNLAIDVRGAGMMITCPGCQGDIQVPFPESDELVEVLTPEEAAAQLQSLKEELAAEQNRTAQLTAELKTALDQPEQLAKAHADNTARFEQISSELVVIQNAIDRIVTLLQDAGVRQA